MRLENVTAVIRPRSDWEAVDLGFAMTRRDFWRCLTVWWLALLLPTAVAGWFLRETPLFLVALFWWWKPAGSRMVLFELSRRLFGEKPGWKAVFKELPRAWTRRFFHRFVWARLSPWLPVTLAVEDLEGLRGNAYRQRASQIARRGDGVVMWIFLLADLTASWVALSFFAIAALFLPEGQGEPWRVAMETFDIARPHDIPLIITWTAAVCLMVGISLTDLFVIGAGFGIYVNNRTWLEGWDVELAFKRLGQRLGKVVALLLMVAAMFSSSPARAQEVEYVEKSDAELMREVKADEDFKVHVEIMKVPKVTKGKGTWSWLEWAFSRGGVGSGIDVARFFGYTAVAILVGLLGWLIWRNRHVFKMRLANAKVEELPPPVAKVVMGMAVTAESLPKDIPEGAWLLWQQGRRHEALALLYRGTISKIIDSGRVQIQESDTEGDCLRRVESAGPMAHPDYFKDLTGVWMKSAYAGVEPLEMEVKALCGGWPFAERRKG